MLCKWRNKLETLKSKKIKRKYANYLKKEFRIIIVKMIKNLENKMEKMQESIKKNLE